MILHNGILSPDCVDALLPTAWSYRSSFQTLPQTPNYLKERPDVIPIDCGRQLFVDDFLIEESDETPGVKGLGIFKGKIVKIPEKDGLKIPHMGWNSITVNKNSRILKNIGSEPYVYFVHSYYVNAEDESIISAYTEYGQKLDIAVEKDNVFATQFHPEKSGETGMTILKNFIAL